MWWKIYFWVYSVLLIALGLIVYGTKRVWLPVHFVEIGMSILVVLGLYSFVYRKKLASGTFWKIVFWFFMTSALLEILYKFTSFDLLSSILESKERPREYLVVSLLIGIPYLYAFYKLGNSAVKEKTVARKGKKK